MSHDLLALKNASPEKLLTDLSSETREKIAIARNAGKSLRAIAADFALSHGSVQRLLKKEGISGPLLHPSACRGVHAMVRRHYRFSKACETDSEGKDSQRSMARLRAGDAEGLLLYPFLDAVPALAGKEQADRSVRQGNGKKTALTVEPTASNLTIPDYTADEDATAEDYWKDRIDPRASVHALYGNACALKVDKGELVSLNDGEVRRFSKVTHGLKAIVFFGQSGNLTLEAIKWCEAQGIALCLLDWYGGLLSVTQPALKTDVAIRRVQFAANPFPIARAILGQKFAGQRRIGKLSQVSYRSALADMKRAKSVDELVKIEGRSALEYWSKWTFELKHKKRNWPDQWTYFHYRASPISGGPRHAMHPVNAVLNYAYSIVAAQVTRITSSLGLR